MEGLAGLPGGTQAARLRAPSPRTLQPPVLSVLVRVGKRGFFTAQRWEQERIPGGQTQGHPWEGPQSRGARSGPEVTGAGHGQEGGKALVWLVHVEVILKHVKSSIF